jgi:hypothetical protein
MAKKTVKKEAKKEVKQGPSFRHQLDDHPVRNCMIAMVIAAGCTVAGVYMKNPLYIALGLLPAAAFQAYRTWGPLTRFASFLFLVMLIAEAVLIVMGINFDLGKFAVTTSRHAAAYNLPLGDIKVVMPLVMALLSLILVIRTAGPYTKWLSLIIITGSIFLVYILCPHQFPSLVEWFSVRINKFIRFLTH